MKIFFAVARTVVAVALAAAILTQLAASLGFWLGRGDHDIPFKVVNFFSFFSIDSAVAGVIVLLIGAGLSRASRVDPGWFTLLRASVFVYLLATGVLYNVLERGGPAPDGLVVWSNEFIHVVAPLYVIVDWLLARGGTRLSWRRLWPIPLFPAAWSLYTLVRGAGAAWYPYPFVDPGVAPGGYPSVVLALVSFVAVTALLGVAAIWASRGRPASIR
jgi:hypothetical protein